MKKSECLLVGVGLLDPSAHTSSNSGSSGLNKSNEGISSKYEGPDGYEGIGPFVLSFDDGLGGIGPFVLSFGEIGGGKGVGSFVLSSGGIGELGGVGSCVLSSGGIGGLEVLAYLVLSSGLDVFLGDSASGSVGSGGGCTLALSLEGFFSWLILLAKSTSFKRLFRWINLEANLAPHFAMITFPCSFIACTSSSKSFSTKELC